MKIRILLLLFSLCVIPLIVISVYEKENNSYTEYDKCKTTISYLKDKLMYQHTFNMYGCDMISNKKIDYSPCWIKPLGNNNCDILSTKPYNPLSRKDFIIFISIMSSICFVILIIIICIIGNMSDEERTNGMIGIKNVITLKNIRESKIESL